MKPLWETITKRDTHYPELTHKTEVDVAIIGGGITGVTAATELLKKGKKVAIIEAEQIGGVTTGNSTGNLYIPVQPFYQKIAATFDVDTAKAIAQARQYAIDYIENQVQEKKINCHFARRPWFGYTHNHEKIKLDEEMHLFEKMQIPVTYVNELPFPFSFKKAIKLENQARFNPLQYVVSLAEWLKVQGCLIFENSRIINIQEKDHCILKTEKSEIHAQKVMMATHTPIGLNVTHAFTAPYRSYVISVTLKNNHYPEAHCWDLDHPTHATCTHAINSEHPELLMVAGSHHKVGQDNDCHKNFDFLENFLNRHFSVEKVEYQWSAQHYQSADSVPYIGLAHRSSKNIYMATGYFADGLVYGMLAGKLLSDVMFDEKNDFLKIVDSTRFDLLKSMPFLLTENTNVFNQYLKDNFLFFDKQYDDLKAGEGKIVNINDEACAVSKDEHNKLHVVSAVCTHMKCIVNWNNAEKTWDCPCHGSRFTQTGKVIEGPAMRNLAYKN